MANTRRPLLTKIRLDCSTKRSDAEAKRFPPDGWTYYFLLNMALFRMKVSIRPVNLALRPELKPIQRRIIENFSNDMTPII